MSSGLSSVQTPFPERPSDRPAWHNDASLLAAVVKDLTTSTQPAVAFSSLAASCVPVLADECVIVIRELGNRQADGPAPFTIRYPATPRPPTRRDPPRSTSQFESQSASGGASITVTSEVDGDCDEPGFVVTAIFSWRSACLVDEADQAVADLLVANVVAQVRRGRLVAALDRACDQAAHLAEALGSNRRIGQALGILMSQYKVTEQQAFDVLRSVSQHTHRKLRDIADDVCMTGTLDLAGNPCRSRSGPSPNPTAPRLRAVDGARP